MTWQAAIDQLNTAVLDTEHGMGDPCTLADGTALGANGGLGVLFTLNNQPGWGYGTELVDALEQQPQPSIQLADADAATHAAQLSVGALITVRGTTYTIAEPPEPDGHGLTRITLMRSQAQDADASAPAQRWR